jgi:hypothetical protein
LAHNLDKNARKSTVLNEIGRQGNGLLLFYNSIFSYSNAIGFIKYYSYDGRGPPPKNVLHLHDTTISPPHNPPKASVEQVEDQIEYSQSPGSEQTETVLLHRATHSVPIIITPPLTFFISVEDIFEKFLNFANIFYDTFIHQKATKTL